MGLQHEQKLFPYRPPPRRQSAQRRIFLTTPKLAEDGFVAAALTRFVVGDRIYRGFLKRLDPPPEEIWEIRVTQPRPQWRLFGRFAEPDTLILTGFFTRGHLGDKGSEAWREAMADCAERWEALFPNHAPYSAASIHDYVTENCDDFPVNSSGKRRPCPP